MYAIMIDIHRVDVGLPKGVFASPRCRLGKRQSRRLPALHNSAHCSTQAIFSGMEFG